MLRIALQSTDTPFSLLMYKLYEWVEGARVGPIRSSLDGVTFSCTNPLRLECLGRGEGEPSLCPAAQRLMASLGGSESLIIVLPKCFRNFGWELL